MIRANIILNRIISYAYESTLLLLECNTSSTTMVSDTAHREVSSWLRFILHIVKPNLSFVLIINNQFWSSTVTAVFINTSINICNMLLIDSVSSVWCTDLFGSTIQYVRLYGKRGMLAPQWAANQAKGWHTDLTELHCWFFFFFHNQDVVYYGKNKAKSNDHKEVPINWTHICVWKKPCQSYKISCLTFALDSTFSDILRYGSLLFGRNHRGGRIQFCAAQRNWDGVQKNLHQLYGRDRNRWLTLFYTLPVFYKFF